LTAWITPTEAKQYSLVKWDSLNYQPTPPSPFANESSFDAFLTSKIIPRAQAHINRHCKRDFDTDYPSGIPEDIKDVCARAVANMIQILVMNKSGPLIRVSDYKISMPDQPVLTDDMKADLEAYVKKTDPVFYEQPIE
jgi:hypothetical protein